MGLLRPNILIIFGALLILYYMNWLQGGGAMLALGIVAVVMAAYYVAIGVLGIVIGDKLPKKVFDIISASLYPLFMFVYFLITLINLAGIANYMGPTAWVIAILSLIGSLGLAVLYPLAKLTNDKLLTKLSFLFAPIFALILLLNIVFDSQGNSNVLGMIDMILLAIYLVYCFYLFSAMGGEEPASAAEKGAEEPQQEEVPAQEFEQEPEPEEEPVAEEEPEESFETEAAPAKDN